MAGEPEPRHLGGGAHVLRGAVNSGLVETDKRATQSRRDAEGPPRLLCASASLCVRPILLSA